MMSEEQPAPGEGLVRSKGNLEGRTLEDRRKGERPKQPQVMAIRFDPDARNARGVFALALARGEGS